MNVSLKSYDTSTLDGQSSTVLLPAPKAPGIPRREEVQAELETPVPSVSQKALIELRTLHERKRSKHHHELTRTTAAEHNRPRRSSRQSKRGKRPYKPGSNPGLMREITNPRNLYHNDTVKHLMNQLSELNNFTYGKLVDERRGNESFCSEITLQSRRENNRNSAKDPDSKPNEEMTRPPDTTAIRRSHHVMKLIERQIMRDLPNTHLASKHVAMAKAEEAGSTKTHSEELPGGMKVVITKTRRKDEVAGQNPSRRGESRHKRPDITFPSISSSKQSGSKEIRRSRHEKYEWSLEESSVLKRDLLPSMNGVKVLGQMTQQNPSTVSTAPSSRQQKSYPTPHTAERVHTSLPKIQEEPDFRFQGNEPPHDTKTTRDVGTNCSPENTERTPSESPENVKVKLPILGKSFGQQRELNYEGGSRFVKPSLREIKRIIHGLYGDYFDSTLGRYYTYEKQLHEGKLVTSEADTPLHYVTPAWDESDTPAASHTLQLFQSGSKRADDGVHTKQQSRKISIPLIRSKYGKAIATSNKSAERRLERNPRRNVNSDRMAFSQPVMRHETHALGDIEAASVRKPRLSEEDIPPRISPNTPENGGNTLRSHIAHQVALYHEQIARENRTLGQDYPKNVQNASRYVFDGNDEKDMLSQFSKDIDRYAEHIINLESYVEAKRQRSLERKAKLREIKQRQKERKQQQNKYLEVVEQREAFLAQVSSNAVTGEQPKTPPNTENANDQPTGDITFEYIHDDHRYDRTPITKIHTESTESQQTKQPMETKIYRIFGDRKKSSTVRRWVARSPVPFTSRIIKRQVTRSSKASKKPIVIHQPKQTRQITHYKPRMLTDLVSRFQVATRYKLDRDYVASLASGTS